MENFKYDPVVSSLSQIRLICLLPRLAPRGVEDRQQIRCQMKTVSLHDCPEYIALSYTWGDPSRTSLLNIDNHVCHITKSVEAALLHLRHKTETETLWIDQLCINQDDNVEKGEQVRLMKDIYQGAKEVVAWLGPAADQSDQLIHALSMAGQVACETKLMHPDLSDEERELEYTESYKRLVKRLGFEPTFPKELMEGLRSLVTRPYWTRVWIVQELSLARDVIFACGEKRVSYDHLRHGLFFFTFYNLCWLKDFTARNSLLEIQGDAKKLEIYNTFTSAPVRSAADKMIPYRHKYLCQIENKGHDLYNILQHCHVIDSSEMRLEATNHRDKIYGLLGLARNTVALGIIPNYDESTSLSTVYTDTARALIRYGHVDLLWLCQFPKSTDGLPTWVPDWSAPIQTP